MVVQQLAGMSSGHSARTLIDTLIDGYFRAMMAKATHLLVTGEKNVTAEPKYAWSPAMGQATVYHSALAQDTAIISQTLEQARRVAQGLDPRRLEGRLRSRIIALAGTYRVLADVTSAQSVWWNDMQSTSLSTADRARDAVAAFQTVAAQISGWFRHSPYYPTDSINTAKQLLREQAARSMTMVEASLVTWLDWLHRFGETTDTHIAAVRSLWLPQRHHSPPPGYGHDDRWQQIARLIQQATHLSHKHHIEGSNSHTGDGHRLVALFEQENTALRGADVGHAGDLAHRRLVLAIGSKLDTYSARLTDLSHGLHRATRDIVDTDTASAHTLHPQVTSADPA